MRLAALTCCSWKQCWQSTRRCCRHATGTSCCLVAAAAWAYATPWLLPAGEWPCPVCVDAVASARPGVALLPRHYGTDLRSRRPHRCAARTRPPGGSAGLETTRSPRHKRHDHAAGRARAVCVVRAPAKTCRRSASWRFGAVACAPRQSRRFRPASGTLYASGDRRAAACAASPPPGWPVPKPISSTACAPLRCRCSNVCARSTPHRDPRGLTIGEEGAISASVGTFPPHRHHAPDGDLPDQQIALVAGLIFVAVRCARRGCRGFAWLVPVVRLLSGGAA